MAREVATRYDGERMALRMTEDSDERPLENTPPAPAGSMRGQFLVGVAIGAFPLVLAEIAIGGIYHGGSRSTSYLGLLLVSLIFYVLFGVVVLTQSVYGG